MDEEKGLALGLCRQSVLKLESVMNDFNEIIEDESLNDEQRLLFEEMSEICGRMMANIVNIVSTEMDEDTFLGERIAMDHISMNEDGSYPEEEMDILDQEL